MGRLDKDSEGLILMTNDGGLVNKINRFGNNHEKEYIVKVNKPLTNTFVDGMSKGVPILDTVTRPCTVNPMDKFTFRIVLTQGLNRQIRRMCEHFGYKVISLKRIRIVNIQLGHLKAEVGVMFRAVSGPAGKTADRLQRLPFGGSGV